MELKKILPFCFSVPTVALAVTVITVNFKDTGLVCIAGTFLFLWAIGIHSAVKNAVNRTVAQTQSGVPMFLDMNSAAGPRFNVDGTPMIAGGAIDANGKPFGFTSSTWSASSPSSSFDSWSSSSSSSYDSSSSSYSSSSSSYDSWR